MLITLDPDRLFDVIVIGGGITGAGVARDAALRGLSCLLLEKGDFASGTTSKSTRLIHGGLRYLAQFEMNLVAESLRERSILRRLAPYLIHPVPILIPIYRHDAHGRIVLSIGIHLYDLLSHERDIPHYFTSGREKTLELEPRLNPEDLKGSALFYDHQIIMPERLVVENVISARESGAVVLNYVRADRVQETGNAFVVNARDVLTRESLTFRCRVLVNAAGPWVDQVRKVSDINTRNIIFPTKGVHLVIPKVSSQALFVSSRDGRMFFIVPLGAAYSLIGTTDTKYAGDLDDVHADPGDVDYLLTESKKVFPTMNLRKSNICYTYAGVRPLAFSGAHESNISRRHVVLREGHSRGMITVAGGKLTTYRNMAKDVVDAACRILGLRRRCRTDAEPFPGALPTGYDEYTREAVRMFSEHYAVPEHTASHLIHLYGSRAEKVLQICREDRRLREQISAGANDILAQVVYGFREEGARTLADIVLRRIQVGISGDRGVAGLGKIAGIAGEEQDWTADEIGQQIADYMETISRDKVQ